MIDLASLFGQIDSADRIGLAQEEDEATSERFLVDEPYLLDLTSGLGGTLADPLKTTVVQDRRCMTTWVLTKAG